jgi:predicted AlkP superfamily phosphohydrolase/phosphomutase
MEIEPTDARQRHGATLWEVALDAGLRSVVVNVPTTHPSPTQDGIFLVPGAGAPGVSESVTPPSLARWIAQEAPGYRIDVHGFEHHDPADFLAAAGRVLDARTRVVEALLRRERPDLCVAVFTASDRVQHVFWKQSQLPHVAADRAGWRFASAIRDTYRRLDDALGRLVEAAGPDATILVVSDHGFGDLDGDLFLNTILEDAGLLRVRRRERHPGWLASRLGLGPKQPEPPTPGFGDVEWGATRAYARGLMGGIWLNLRGREPVGIVEPGPQADALLDRLEAIVLAARGPDGGPLVDCVFRGAELYPGPRSGELPDLIVVPHRYRYMTRAGREFGPRGALVAPPAVKHTGNHRLDGIFVGAGPGIHAGRALPRLHLLDLTPTCLALLGIEVPRGLDGEPMEAALSCEVGWTDSLPWREPVDTPRGEEERGRIEAQLRGLGYLVAGPSS